MDKNLRMRLIVGFGLFFVALVALYTFDAIPFKVIFGLFAFVAAIELFSFFLTQAIFGISFLVSAVTIFLLIHLARFVAARFLRSPARFHTFPKTRPGKVQFLALHLLLA